MAYLRTVCTRFLLLAILTNFLAITVASLARDSREIHEHEDDDDYVEIGNYLLEVELADMREEFDFFNNPEQNVTFDQVVSLVEIVFGRIDCEQRVDNCSKCQHDFTSDVFSSLDIDVADGLDDVEFLRASPLFLFGAYEMVAVCQAGRGGTDLTESVVMASLKMAAPDSSNLTLTENDLEVILESIHDSYAESSNAKCFSVESVFDETVNDHEAGADDDELQYAAQAVVAGLLQGYCIGEPTLPSTTDFTEAIFDTFATFGVITEEEFAHMLIHLGIGGDDGHDHEHARRRRDVIATRSKGRSIEKRATVLADDHDHANHSHSHVANVTTTCFSSEELLDIYGIDHEAGITEEQFNELSPSLVQQILSGACEITTTEPSDISKAKMWGYGTLAVFIISLFAVLGGLFVPCMSEGFYDKTIQTMIALAVATLTGDAVLHLLPQAVGLHTHDSSDHSAHTPTSPEMAYIWKCLVVEMAIYVFFVFEQLTSFTKCGHSHHSHTQSADVEMAAKGQRGRALSGQGSFATGKNGVSHSESKMELTANEAKAFETETPLPTEDTDCCVRGCNPVAMMILLGDSLHNFGDGLAIGAAFSLSIAAGLSTSIAVLCHEIPHELGDLAVLMKQGMRLRTALLLNMICACSAFIGLWIGIPLGQTETAREWIFAAVAGMFFYVGLVDMLPMLHQYDGKSNKVTVAILQNIGFLAGIGIILLIALYEDAITVSI
ncbi:zinc transporter ZIP8-like [Strongylocentrotus purpuratus]|uniref:Zinc transporter ZIP12 n=2 Tax=Strongylocentrotus purpuratus TaxID=7668 RepID=A0A7M7PB51_STRPU|nr:zinc transporter ZIP8-like [Strongylocentrotus purpuratus]